MLKSKWTVSDGTVPYLRGSEKLKIGFVGAGKVGTNLARYFADCGLIVSGFFVRTDTSELNNSFKMFNDLSSFIESSDVVFITVKDDQIRQVANEISKMREEFDGKTFAHTSGSNTIDLLDKLKDKGAKVFTFHPLQTFNSKKIDMELMKKMHIFIENKENDEVTVILDSINNKSHSILSNEKIKYHCAASIISNLTTGLIDIGFDLIEEIGVDKSDSKDVFSSLIEGTYKNILEVGPKKALTGPISRGDYSIVEKHLMVLNNKHKKLYKLLAMKTLYLAKDNLTKEKYNKIECLLREDE